MNSAALQPFTLDAFLEWEERQELKHEFDGAAAIAMAGGTAAHAAIQRNLTIAVGGRLVGKPCQFFGSDLKIKLAATIRYPDGIVVCTPVSPTSRFVTDPVVIFEVLSDSTAHIDLGAKNREYEAAGSVLRYLILEQDAIGGMQFARQGGEWLGRNLHPGSVLAMPELGIELPLDSLYEGLGL